MRVFYLANHVPWFGAHTGYERLPHHLASTGFASRILTPGSGLLARATGKAVSLLRGHGSISQTNASARLRLELNLLARRDAIGHLLYGEDHLPFWQDSPRGLRNRTLITFHQPPAQWTAEKARALAACPHALTLWQRDMDWFRSQLQGGTVHFIPHGVDTEFFTPLPASAEQKTPIRLLYVGVHLRNTAMLGRIIGQLSRQRDDLHFDLLVPASRREEPGLAGLRHHPRVTWHSNTTDEQLRDLYRQASLLLLPMNDSGANTAIVEALSCGLPVVTTDVGGIRDYGGGTVFPVVENNNDEAMLALIDRHLAQPAWRDQIARDSRAFAESHLAWPLIAGRHADLYRKLGA